MELLDKELQKYIEAHTEQEPEVLKRLSRETYAKVLMPRMLSGHLQGRLISMMSHMIAPMNILEIGTFTGYSAICFAEGLREGGKVYTIDINEELETMVRRFFKESGVEDKVEYIIGNALEVIPTLNKEFDLVFIDADKINYLNYYEMVLPIVRKGGFIIADNVLWSGKVVGEGKIDKDTRAMLEFNDFVNKDERVQNVLLPVRDGLMILRKL
ncbi:MAG TPA: O-methyltransferase [Cytophagaceae bacterium]